MGKIKGLYIIILLLLCIFQIGFAQNSIKIDPLYLGMMLIDQPSEKKMADICEYYDLEEMQEQEGYRVFRYSNGTEFRFKATKEKGKYLPVVIVETKENEKTIDRILTDAGFVKDGDGYVKGTKFEIRRTRCKVTGGEHKTLIFEKEYNSL